MSLLRAAPAISGAMLADFDSAFVNRFAGLAWASPMPTLTVI
jgi:hypothetical protein